MKNMNIRILCGYSCRVDDRRWLGAGSRGTYLKNLGYVFAVIATQLFFIYAIT